MIKGENSKNGIIKRTMATELILAFAKAVEILSKEYKQDIEHTNNLKKYLAGKIEESIENVMINSLCDEKFLEFQKF